MMAVHKMLLQILALFALVLAFSSLAASAAIPSSPIRASEYEPEPESHQSTLEPSLGPGPASWTPSTQSQSVTADTENHHVAKRTPYYFPETVPDADEIMERLTALREAGFVAHSQDQMPRTKSKSKSIDGPDAAIDTPRARNLPIRVWMSESRVSMARAEVWDTTSTLLPPVAFFAFAAAVVCVATIFKNVRGRH